MSWIQYYNVTVVYRSIFSSNHSNWFTAPQLKLDKMYFINSTTHKLSTARRESSDSSVIPGTMYYSKRSIPVPTDIFKMYHDALWFYIKLFHMTQFVSFVHLRNGCLHPIMTIVFLDKKFFLSKEHDYKVFVGWWQHPTPSLGTCLLTYLCDICNLTYPNAPPDSTYAYLESIQYCFKTPFPAPIVLTLTS